MTSSREEVVGFIEEAGVKFAGKHVIADLWGIPDDQLKNASYIEEVLTDAAKAAGATVLYAYFHTFGPEQGVTGVLVLSESHISIHTWPEEQYAAVDIFMCGKAKPEVALELIKQDFRPERVVVGSHKRGVI